MEKDKEIKDKNRTIKEKNEREVSSANLTSSNKIENQNQTYNSKKEGLGQNGKR